MLGGDNVTHVPPRCSGCKGPLDQHCSSPTCGWFYCPNQTCVWMVMDLRHGKRRHKDGHVEGVPA